MVLVNVSKLQCLLKDSALAAKVRELVNEERGGGAGRSNVDNGVHTSGRESGMKGDQTCDEVEIDEDLQVVKRGYVHCIHCNKDFENMPKLKKHVKLYHNNVYSYYCTICEKGYNSLEGLCIHQKVHKGTVLRCEMTFTN